MTSSAILHGEGDREVADAAEFPFIDVVHAEMFCPFFLDIEDIRVAVGTIKPGRMLLVGKERSCLDPAPFRFEAEDLVKRDGRIIVIEDALFWRDQFLFQGFYPVDLISIK